MTLDGTLGFLGFGNMGGAIAEGLLQTGAMTTRQAVVYDIIPEKRALAAQLGLVVAQSPEDLARQSETLLIAVKPQTVEDALDEVKPGLSTETLIISIAAGISITFIQERLGSAFRVVRVMPNTPALVKTGAAGVALASNCTQADATLAQTIFGAIGIVEMVPEQALDAVTALSGSGPAYFFYLVECLVQAAVAQGLPKGQAARLAGQTLIGAGRLLHETAESAAVLRERVTSKGGTTEAALERFKEHGFEHVIAAGVEAAADRSRELGK